MRVPGATRYVMDTENGREQGGGPALLSASAEAAPQLAWSGACCRRTR